jgi:hypothetical protein
MLVQAAVPTPLRAMVCPTVRDEIKCIDAERGPVPAGVNVTVTEHEAFCCKTAGQLFVCVNSPEFIPSTMTVIGKVAVSGLVIVRDCGVLRVPIV